MFVGVGEPACGTCSSSEGQSARIISSMNWSDRKPAGWTHAHDEREQTLNIAGRDGWLRSRIGVILMAATIGLKSGSRIVAGRPVRSSGTGRSWQTRSAAWPICRVHAKRVGPGPMRTSSDRGMTPVSRAPICQLPRRTTCSYNRRTAKRSASMMIWRDRRPRNQGGHPGYHLEVPFGSQDHASNRTRKMARRTLLSARFDST